MNKINIIILILFIPVVFSGCHSMPLMQSAKTLDENECMTLYGGNAAVQNFHYKTYSNNYGTYIMNDLTDYGADFQLRWGINREYDWGIIFGFSRNIIGAYIGIDLKKSFIKAEDMYLSIDAFLATGMSAYISADLNAIFTKKFGFFSITPILGFGYHGGRDVVDYVYGEDIGYYYNPRHAGFLNVGLILDFTIENREAGKNKDWGFGINFLYRKELTSIASEMYFPGVYFYRMIDWAPKDILRNIPLPKTNVFH